MTLESKIRNSKSYDDLLLLISSQEENFEIVGSHKSYNKDELLKRLTVVEQKIIPINIITRSFGLRKKVMQLLGYKEDQIDWYCKDD